MPPMPPPPPPAPVTSPSRAAQRRAAAPASTRLVASGRASLARGATESRTDGAERSGAVDGAYRADGEACSLRALHVVDPLPVKAMRTWRLASEKGKAAAQRQVFVEEGRRRARCFNLVAEPRLQALATLLIAVAVGCWFGGGTSAGANLTLEEDQQMGARHAVHEFEQQTTFTTILAKSTTMTERVVTAATMIDSSKTSGRSNAGPAGETQPSTLAADLATTPGVPLKPSTVHADLDKRSLDNSGADGLGALSLFGQQSMLLGSGADSSATDDNTNNDGDHVQSHAGHLNNYVDNFHGHSSNFDNNASNNKREALQFDDGAANDGDISHHVHSHSGQFNNDGNHVHVNSGNRNNNGNHVHGLSGYINRNADARHDPWWYETVDDGVLDLGMTTTTDEIIDHDSNAALTANRSLSWHNGSYNNGSFNGTNSSFDDNQTWFSGLREMLWADP
eukprot:s1654_g11.t1